MALSDLQSNRLLTALDTLCWRPLEHPSIARPIECGIEHGHPYLVHTYLEGTSLADLFGRNAPLPLPDIVDRLAFLAGALDFAEAGGVLHGALSSHDVIFSAGNAGVSGFGLVQALESAGVPGFHAHREDDVTAFASIARELLGTRLTPAAAAVLDGPLPGTALAVVGVLQGTLHVAPPPARSQPDLPVPAPVLSITPASPRADQLDLLDIPLRDAETLDRFAADAAVVDTRPMFGMSADLDDVAPVLTTAASAARHSRGSTIGWLVTAAVALALGVFAAFAGGFYAGHDKPAPAPAGTASGPDATSGQAFTDAAVDEPKPADTTAPPPAAPVATPPLATATPKATRTPAPPRQPAASAGAANRVPPPQEAPTGPAAIKVESHPAGAQVFVDGRSVGYAPLVVGELTPGTHSVRMQLPGYHPWVSAVTLGPGARERVAASLEP